MKLHHLVEEFAHGLRLLVEAQEVPEVAARFLDDPRVITTNRAITTSCATTNGASDCVGSIPFTAGLETRRLGLIQDSTQIWEPRQF